MAAADKVAWRKQFLRDRAAIPALVRSALDDQLCAQVVRLLDSRAAVSGVGIVAGYRSFRGEPNLVPALTSAQASGWRVTWPRTDAQNRRLTFHQWPPDAPFAEGVYGIEEPPASATVVPLSAISLFLVPGAAFADGGVRLGYGGGYYDRLFADDAVCGLRVGVAYRQFVLPQLPAAAHDAHMQLVLTESGWSRC